MIKQEQHFGCASLVKKIKNSDTKKTVKNIESQTSGR